jgi:hypothetical protein
VTRAVLLVPRDDLRDALIGVEACGGCPPTAWERPRYGAWIADDALGRMTVGPNTEEDDCETGRERAARQGWRQALVLAWDGRPVPGGVFRAWSVADDLLYEPLSDALYDGNLDVLATNVITWTRDGRPLGEVVVIEGER